ncbi:hypothetical protein PIB30_102901 [Stylosanthes scabra]|uniref:Uncharacterized protein n=1 Tax=Stylosanthes scabra TaxID=79078 RepID=A0ABU6WXR7_9FABA|nr:hypothetical protein [Stylosanthes scabra]
MEAEFVDSQQQSSVAIHENEVPTSANDAGVNKAFRTKQPIRRRQPHKLQTSSTPPADPPNPTDATQQASIQAPISLTAPSTETLAAAGPGAKRIWQFMATPGLTKK